MKIWHQYPFIRLVIPVIIGIITAIYIDLPIFIPSYLFIGIIVIYGVIVFVFPKKVGYKFRWITGVLINIFLVFAGYQLTILNTPRFDKQNIIHYSKSSNEFIIQVTEPVSEKSNSYKVVARSIMLKDKPGWKKISGNIILYFEKDTSVRQIKFGDQLVIQTNLNEVKPPQNPGEFNYKKYLSNKGIYMQGFVRGGQWQVIKRNTGNPVKAFGISIRNKFLEIFESQHIQGREFAVVSAILLGYDDKLDAEQQREFSGAGAMHILCVSGLHVGIIYVILSNLLVFLNRKKSLRIVKVFILLLLIWCYALITGFSPSVLRASTMFSFIIIGQSMKRKTNIYNSLAGSAFLLLGINPYILTQVGFQLSYIAVLGIVTLHRPIYILIIPGNWLLRNIWQITVVSIAATLATFPLSLYYFHQFPNLFLVTNLVAIPASMLIIYTGILVLIFSPLTVISGLFAKILTGIIWFLNFSVKWIEGLSFSTTTGISINNIEMILIFGLILCLTILFLQKKRIFTFYILGFSLLLLLSFTYRSYYNKNQRRIVVYNINKTTAIDFIDGKQVLLLSDSLLNKNREDYHIQNNWTASGINRKEKGDINNPKIVNRYLCKNRSFIQFYNKKILIVGPEFQIFPVTEKMKVDYIVFSQNPKLVMADLIDNFEFDELIFDSSNSYWKINRWILECEEEGIEYYAVQQKGAWEI
jgi:competence protein ComEC